MADSRGEVTVLLGELKLGRKDALERLMPLVYRELRRVAGRCMRALRRGVPVTMNEEIFQKTQLKMGGSR
ncbi:MAG: ECF-type sigma factor [Bryobacteraceae bacterium]|jgi:hypothetical protein